MSEKTKNKFGLILRELAKKKYGTYANAAEKLDISVSFLHQLMRGERKPSFEMLRTFSEKLDDPGLFLDEEKRVALDAARQTIGAAEEKRKRRIELLAWELDLDESSPEDRNQIEAIMPLLPYLKNIPPELISKLASRNGPSMDPNVQELLTLIPRLPSAVLPGLLNTVKSFLAKPASDKNKVRTKRISK